MSQYVWRKETKIKRISKKLSRDRKSLNKIIMTNRIVFLLWFNSVCCVVIFSYAHNNNK